MTNPYEKLRKLQRVVEEICEELGLEIIQFAFMADVDDYGNELNAINAIFGVNPEAVKSMAELEAEELAAQFEELLAGALTEDEHGNLVAIEEPPEPEKSPEQIRMEEKQARAIERLREWSEE